MTFDETQCLAVNTRFGAISEPLHSEPSLVRFSSTTESWAEAPVSGTPLMMACCCLPIDSDPEGRGASEHAGREARPKSRARCVVVLTSPA
jgi:hypothetical protein